MASSTSASAHPWTARTYFLLTVVGVLVYLVLDMVAQSLPPYYSPISQAESDLAVGPYGLIMSANFVVRGLLSLAFVYGLGRALPPSSRLRRGCILFSVWAIGALILSVSATDVNPPPYTLHGLVHLATAIVAFLFGALGVLDLSLAFGKNPSLRLLARRALVLAAFALVFLTALIFGQAAFPKLASDYGGLIERLFLASILGWVLLVSLSMLRSGPKPLSNPS